MKIQSKFGSAGSVLIFGFFSLAVAQEYVPPPTGPYQPSVVINRVDQMTPEQNRIYRFPPADLVGSAPPLMEDNPIPPRPAQIENRPPPQPRQAQAAPRSEPQAYQQVNPQAGNFPAPQWQYNPYQYQSNWNANPQAYPYAQGYQQPYPYGYNQYNGGNNFFPDMPTPWTDNPMQQFFGN